MSVLRKDPLSYGWVIFAEETYRRPTAPCPVGDDVAPADCPFCEGNEDRTPPEIRAIRPVESKPNSRGWQVRTIPNQFAVLRIEGNLERRGEGLYDMMNGVGAHEVIVETPDHYGRMSQFDTAKLREVLWMYRERVQDLLKDKRFRYIQVFRNYGARAGARLHHPHSQVIALPVLPRWVRDEIQHAFEYWGIKERCIFCDILEQDRKGKRLVYENDDFIVTEPFASRMPFETWIYPRVHQSEFHELADSALVSLADALRITLLTLEQALGDPHYNLIFHSAPCQPEKQYNTRRAQICDYYHWHIEIIPRVTELAGFEYGTGFYVNSVFPEKAAAQLRDHISKLIGGSPVR